METTSSSLRSVLMRFSSSLLVWISAQAEKSFNVKSELQFVRLVLLRSLLEPNTRRFVLLCGHNEGDVITRTSSNNLKRKPA